VVSRVNKPGTRGNAAEKGREGTRLYSPYTDHAVVQITIVRLACSIAGNAEEASAADNRNSRKIALDFSC
jgi:hypothetical protein